METIDKYIGYVKKDILGKVPEYLWCERHFVLKVVKNCPSAFVYASAGLQNDRKFVKQAVNLNSEVIKYVSERLKNDKGIALLAVRKNGENLAFVSGELRNDADVIEASLGGNLYKLRYAPEEARDNKEIAIRALSRYGHVIEFVSDRLKADRDVVTAAVGSAWNALGFARGGLNDDRCVVLAAVKHCGIALQFASDRLRDDKEIVLTAIENCDADVLEYASDRLKDDKETVLSAVQKSEYSIAFASGRMRHDSDVIRAVLDTFPSAFERLPDDVQENLDHILFGLESVVRHLPDPEKYTFFEDSTSRYYADYDCAGEDFLDILESIPQEVLRKDSDLNEKVCRLAVRMDDAYYEGDYPYQDVSCRIVSMVEDLYEEKDIPLRPVLKEKLAVLRSASEEKKESKYKHLEQEKRLFYENLDLYEGIVCRSILQYGAERERDFLSPGGGFVRNCMMSFVKDLIYAWQGLYHDSELWTDDCSSVDLNKAYNEISLRLSPGIKVVRNAYEYYYSENVTVELNDNVHLILVRAVTLKIFSIWVNKHDSEHEHGKWLAPDRLDEFCDMVGYIVDVYGKYEELAGQRAAELREKYGL